MSMMTSKCIQLHCVLIKIEEETKSLCLFKGVWQAYSLQYTGGRENLNLTLIQYLALFYLFLSRAERAIKNRATVYALRHTTV